MKRDKELLRSLLNQLHVAPAGEWVSQVKVEEGVSLPVVIDHVQQLIEIGLVEGETGGDFFIMKRLTSSGHDFVEAAATPQAWEIAMERAGSAPLEVFKGVLIEVVAEIIKRTLLP